MKKNKKLAIKSKMTDAKIALIILALLLPFQTCNASIFDNLLDWLSPLWTANEIEMSRSIDAPAELTFELVDMNGNVHTQNSLQGKYLIINFWATWCPPCLKEIPAFVEFYNNHSDTVEILGLNYEGMDFEAVNNFKERFSVNYPIVLYAGNNEAEYSKFGDLVGMPTTLVYNPNGKLLHTFIGEIGIEELAQFIPTNS